MANINNNRKPNKGSEKPANVANINESSVNVEMSTSENNNNNNSMEEREMENITQIATTENVFANDIFGKTIPEIAEMVQIRKDDEQFVEFATNHIAETMIPELTAEDKPFYKMYGLSEYYTPRFMTGILRFLLLNTNVANPIEFMKYAHIPEVWEMLFITPSDDKVHPSPTNTNGYSQSLQSINLLIGKTKSIYVVDGFKKYQKFMECQSSQIRLTIQNGSMFLMRTW